MQEERIHRRLAAILAADVVGYARLVRVDEEGTIVRLTALRRELIEQRVAKNAGRIVKVMGDGILIEFPSAVDAVRCAAEVQQAMVFYNAAIPEAERLEFRAGINLGDVVIEGDDIHGDGVNIAARLESIAPPSGLCISDAVHEQVRDRIGFTFRDLGKREVKNIDRPIRVWEWRPSAAAPSAVSADDRPASPEKPSIAVLPFQNMSGDPEQEYFAEGMAEDIITALSRIRWYFVIARNSSFTYKGRAIDVKQLGRELGVRYVLEGSVRRAGQRLRVTAQLVDALTGAHVWAERYDRELDDIFEIQDEITQSVVASMETSVQISEGSLFENVERPSLPVWGLVNRSWKEMYTHTPESLAEAIRLAEEAVALDPNSARAHQALSTALWHLAWMALAEDCPAALSRARHHAEEAVRLDPHNEYAHWCLGLALLADGEHDKAISQLERALEINPNCCLARGSLATVQYHAGYPEEAISNNLAVLRQNPRGPSNCNRYTGLAISHFLVRQFDEGVDWARRALRIQPQWHQCHIALIANLIGGGRVEEARRCLRDYLQSCPGASLAQVAALPFRDPAHHKRLIEALREAGCPE